MKLDRSTMVLCFHLKFFFWNNPLYIDLKQLKAFMLKSSHQISLTKLFSMSTMNFIHSVTDHRLQWFKLQPFRIESFCYFCIRIYHILLSRSLGIQWSRSFLDFCLYPFCYLITTFVSESFAVHRWYHLAVSK